MRTLVVSGGPSCANDFPARLRTAEPADSPARKLRQDCATCMMPLLLFAWRTAILPWPLQLGQGGQTLQLTLPLAFVGRPNPDFASLHPGYNTLTTSCLLAADDVRVGRLLLEEAAVHHPVDLLLELGRLVALHAGQFRQHAGLALLRLEVAQQLLARALLVLARAIPPRG